MRRLVILVAVCLASRLIAGPTPPELAEALKSFRAEGPKGWAFKQTTVSGDRSRVEHFDPQVRGPLQWTLVQQDGRAPTPDEAEKYKQLKATRTSPDNAPNVKDQIRPETCELVEDTPERGVYRFQLKPTDKDDTSAEFMRATFTLHRPTRTIEKVELASTGPFSPVLMVNIQEARTVMLYSLPKGELPSLLQQVTMRVRGRAMWFRSLDQDMIVSYSGYVFAGKH